MKSFSENITINHSAASVWKALCSIGTIDQWNPGVEHSFISSTSETGVGACRRCELGGKNYLDEEVVEWIPEQKLTMRIVKTNLPFASADIKFELTQVDDETRVSVTPIYKLKYGIVGSALDKLVVRSQYQKGMKDLLLGLKHHVESNAN